MCVQAHKKQKPKLDRYYQIYQIIWMCEWTQEAMLHPVQKNVYMCVMCTSEMGISSFCIIKCICQSLFTNNIDSHSVEPKTISDSNFRYFICSGFSICHLLVLSWMNMPFTFKSLNDSRLFIAWMHHN